ncbi:MAG: hypothetical protein IT431_02785 [Phycisphaerales bacterium]|nr:hypothetical protein [Phycisphaerales bacterium]
MTRTTLAAVGAIASVTALATAQRAPEPFLGGGTLVEPLRVAPAVFGPDGARMVGDWMPLPGQTAAGASQLVFDCFAPTGDCSEGYYCYEPSHCNLFWTNDMTVAPGTVVEDGASRADFAWFWTAGGEGTSERCIIAVFTQDSVPCDPDSFDYGGWLLDFGTIPSSVGHGYYFANVELTSGVWSLPTGGAGSYGMFYLQDITSSGSWVAATCAQPMLWATGEDRGDPAAPGTQGPLQMDDVAVMDGSHSSSECYSYAITDCPYELGGAAAFWGVREDGCLGLFPNCDGNGGVNTQDFLCFLGKWSAAFQSGSYDADADCDGNGVINTQDFLCFLGKFAACF